MRFLCVTACLLMSLYPSISYAQEGDHNISQLMQLDIEELFQVSVASKKNEPLKDAPSIVSVVTQKDIQQYGAKNLIDIFNRIPSLQTYGSHLINGNGLSIRGQSNQFYMTRILFLINGRPFRDSVTGGWNFPLYSMFPINSIERIEVIRGPGSVLYGTNAFSGVINIVTESHSGTKQADVAIVAGSNDTYALETQYSDQIKDLDYHVAVKGTATEGWDQNYVSEGGAGSISTGSEGFGIYTNIAYKKLTVNGFFASDDREYLDGTNQFPLLEQRTRRGFVDLGYEHPLSNDWRVKLNSTYNLILREDATTDHANDLVLEAFAEGPLKDNLSLSIGGTFEHQNGHFLTDTSFQTHIWGAYSQLTYAPNERMKFVGGLQFNKPQNSKQDISPRMAAVYKFNDRLSFKAMYGEAFRAPAGLEAYINVPPAITGDTGMKPEKVATKELQLLYIKSEYTKASLNYYHSRITDQIGRIPNGGGVIITNTGNVTFEGIELDGRTSWGQNNEWSAQGSILLQHNEDSSNTENTTFTPNFMVKAGISYNSPKGWNIGLFDSYFHEPTQVRELNPAVLEVNPDAEAYHWVTANVEFDLNKFLKDSSKVRKTFSIYGENLIGEDIYYPEFNRQNLNSFPTYAGGRTIYGRLKVAF